MEYNIKEIVENYQFHSLESKQTKYIYLIIELQTAKYR